MDIANIESVKNRISFILPDYLINTAAYTNVDKAENESENAFSINAYALRNIGQMMPNGKIIHLSTDYVYHNNCQYPMKESEEKSPKGVYAKSKLLGEEILRSCHQKALILRTSWLYSSYGHNFVKTMIRLSQSHTSIKIVDDQIGTPTYAPDLAKAIMHIISRDSQHAVTKSDWNDTYNYSNEGTLSWYEFATNIFSLAKIDIEIHPIPSSMYPQAAPRPSWSVMDTKKVKEAFQMTIPQWRSGLEKCIAELIN